MPEQDASAAAVALVGLLTEGLIGPLAPAADAGKARESVQTVTLLALRALGVLDARARGLVVQTALPRSGRGMPARSVNAPPASSTMICRAARSQSVTSVSAEMSAAPSATSMCDQKSP